jgi:tetratricopeptide (TPR) repeat protein
MAAFRLWDAPDEGRIHDALSVPLLLAQAWRQRREGVLFLSCPLGSLAIEERSGEPVAVQSTKGEPDAGFAAFLLQSQRVEAATRSEIESFAARNDCAEASATLALKLLSPSDLYQALRDHQRQRLATSFEWREGEYRWAPLGTDCSPSSARPLDLLALLQRELPSRWTQERLFSEIAQVQTVRGDVATSNRKIARKLASSGSAAARALAQLDGEASLGQILGRCAGEPLAAITLWTMLHTGLLRLTNTKPAAPGPLERLEFEIESEADGRPILASGPVGPAVDHRREAASQPTRGEDLQLEIERRLAQLATVDHYTALDLAPDASPSQIKKAYFKAAKRFHPDAISRLGHAALETPAARVFARISEAFETLSDEAKRRAYDESGGATEIDPVQIAQAETAFRKGEILVRMGQFEGALEYLESAVSLWPEEPAYHALLGWALYKQRHPDAARAADHLERALTDSREDALVHFRLGLVLRALGQRDRADALIQKAHALEPRDRS